MTKIQEGTETLATVDDRYHELGERAKSCLDSPEFSPLHAFIKEMEEAVEGLVGSGRRSKVIDKTRKLVIAAVNSRIDRQMTGSTTSVRPYRPRRRDLGWRNK